MSAEDNPAAEPAEIGEALVAALGFEPTDGKKLGRKAGSSASIADELSEAENTTVEDANDAPSVDDAFSVVSADDAADEVSTASGSGSNGRSGASVGSTTAPAKKATKSNRQRNRKNRNSSASGAKSTAAKNGSGSSSSIGAKGTDSSSDGKPSLDDIKSAAKPTVSEAEAAAEKAAASAKSGASKVTDTAAEVADDPVAKAKAETEAIRKRLADAKRKAGIVDDGQSGDSKTDSSDSTSSKADSSSSSPKAGDTKSRSAETKTGSATGASAKTASSSGSGSATTAKTGTDSKSKAEDTKAESKSKSNGASARAKTNAGTDAGKSDARSKSDSASKSASSKAGSSSSTESSTVAAAAKDAAAKVKDSAGAAVTSAKAAVTGEVTPADAGSQPPPPAAADAIKVDEAAVAKVGKVDEKIPTSPPSMTPGADAKVDTSVRSDSITEKKTVGSPETIDTPAVAPQTAPIVGRAVPLPDLPFPNPFRRKRRVQARKVRRVVRHIDPWSVLTFSVLFHLCVFAALLLSSVLVWNAAEAAGTIENLETFILDLGDYETYEIHGDVVFKAAVAIAGILTLASSVMLVLLTVVFNLISDLVGGIRLTVIEEETVRVRRRKTRS